MIIKKKKKFVIKLAKLKNNISQLWFNQYYNVVDKLRSTIWTRQPLHLLQLLSSHCVSLDYASPATFTHRIVPAIIIRHDHLLGCFGIPEHVLRRVRRPLNAICFWVQQPLRKISQKSIIIIMYWCSATKFFPGHVSLRSTPDCG